MWLCSSLPDWFALGHFLSQCPYQLHSIEQSNKLRLLITELVFPFFPDIKPFCTVLAMTRLQKRSLTSVILFPN